jgi:hypothetical protein
MSKQASATQNVDSPDVSSAEVDHEHATRREPWGRRSGEMEGFDRAIAIANHESRSPYSDHATQYRGPTHSDGRRNREANLSAAGCDQTPCRLGAATVGAHNLQVKAAPSATPVGHDQCL